MTLNADRRSHRLHWGGILAGLVMGLVSTLTIVALGTVITALTGLTLTGTGIAAGLWTALAALIGAYVAGLTAVRASAPTTRNTDGIAAMTHDDATVTGLVTGGLLVLLSTLFAFNTASRLIGTATTIVGNVAGAATSAAGTAGSAVAQNGGLPALLSGVNEQDVVNFVADASPNLNPQQVQATANVVTGIFRRAQYDLGNVNPANLGDFASARVNAIKQALTGDQFVTRLTRQGLSQAQAQEVRTSITGQIDRLEQQATQLAQTAEATARTTARNTGLIWLLGAGLTLLLTVMGARSAATNASARRVVELPNPGEPRR
ncbi:hypothetical protein [Deinococcus aluminii]|uniref:Uncharacterized protein n=1 Tax=Deinococcus aluminii TaxID=1656885 RepID=A0ABP9XF50_9DEIO